MGCKCGGDWKVLRKDKQCTDEGTVVILHLKCKLCGAVFQTDELEDEHDFEGAENYDRQ